MKRTKIALAAAAIALTALVLPASSSAAAVARPAAAKVAATHQYPSNLSVNHMTTMCSHMYSKKSLV
jgi:hypothetical protein